MDLTTEPIATRIAAGNQLIMRANTNNFFVLNTDTKATGLEKFDELYPKRTIHIGISEQNLMGIASGLSSVRGKVFVSVFSVFASMRSLEQIRTFIAYPNMDVTILATHSGLQVGKDGATHQAIEDISIMSAIPNMTVLQPSNINNTQQIMDFALNYHKPLYIRLHRSPVPKIDLPSRFCFGQISEVWSSGDDVVIFSTGIVLSVALKTAREVHKLGIRTKVIDVMTLKPFPVSEVLRVIKNTKLIITIEDAVIHGGLGSMVSEVLSERHPISMRRFGIHDVFLGSGDAESLYSAAGITSDNISKYIEAFFRGDLVE